MTDSPLADYLFQQPITPKQKALNKLDVLESMMTQAADSLSKRKAGDDLKTLCNECLKDIALSKNLLNNWDAVTVANDLIEKINSKRWRLWERNAVLSLNKDKASKGGQATAENKANELKERNNSIKKRAKALRDLQNPECRIAGMLAPQFNLSARQIRDILKSP